MMGIFNQTAYCAEVDYQSGVALFYTDEHFPLYVVVMGVPNNPKFALKSHRWVGDFSQRKHLQIRTKLREWPHSLLVEVALKTSNGHVAYWMQENGLEWCTKYYHPETLINGESQ